MDKQGETRTGKLLQQFVRLWRTKSCTETGLSQTALTQESPRHGARHLPLPLSPRLDLRIISTTSPPLRMDRIRFVPFPRSHILTSYFQLMAVNEEDRETSPSPPPPAPPTPEPVPSAAGEIRHQSTAHLAMSDCPTCLTLLVYRCRPTKV